MKDSTSTAMNGGQTEANGQSEKTKAIGKALAEGINAGLNEAAAGGFAGGAGAVRPRVARREWTLDGAMGWLLMVAEGRERHGLQACSAFSFLLSIGVANIAYALMAGIQGRLNRDREQTEAKAA